MALLLLPRPQIIDGRVHKLLYTKRPIQAGREILLDYGENYWDAWRKGSTDGDEAEFASPEEHNDDDDQGCSSESENGSGTAKETSEVLEMERFEPLDRTAARAAVGHEDEWEWARCGASPPPSTLDLEPATCQTSVSALDPTGSYVEAEVVLPDFYRSQLTLEFRERLLAAVRSVSHETILTSEQSWLQSECIFGGDSFDLRGCASLHKTGCGWQRVMVPRVSCSASF
jgi:hypothetical protein